MLPHIHKHWQHKYSWWATQKYDGMTDIILALSRANMLVEFSFITNQPKLQMCLSSSASSLMKQYSIIILLNQKAGSFITYMCGIARHLWFSCFHGFHALLLSFPTTIMRSTKHMWTIGINRACSCDAVFYPSAKEVKELDEEIADWACCVAPAFVFHLPNYGFPWCHTNPIPRIREVWTRSDVSNL